MSYKIKEILTNKDVNIKVLHHFTPNCDRLDLTILTTDELAKYDSYGSDKRKLEFYFSRVLWLTFNQNQVIEYKPTGKPILSKGFISISHSHSYIIVAFSKTEPIGIDIELISEKINKVKSKFLHPKDRYVNLKELTQLWTIKEAFYKLHDGDDVFLMDDVYIARLANKSYAEVKLDKVELHGLAQSFYLDTDFIVSLLTKY